MGRRTATGRVFTILRSAVLYIAFPLVLTFLVSSVCVLLLPKRTKSCAVRVWPMGEQRWRPLGKERALPTFGPPDPDPLPRFERFSRTIDELWRAQFLDQMVFGREQEVMTWSTFGVESEFVKISNIDDSYREVARVSTLRSGWPLLSFTANARAALYNLKGSYGSYPWNHIFVVPLSLQSKVASPFVPLKPMWFGLVLNTMFYAGLIWACFSGRRLLVRSIRSRRGRCVACGYDRAGLSPGSVCPECGPTRAL